uniref:Uncharacterized protein n=1 Tax=Oryza rufipogon TaxID=4529 RepID=A0A0E0MTH2_ORYRU
MAAAAVGVASRARRSSGPRGVAFCRWTNGLLHPRFVFPEAAAVAGSGAGSAQANQEQGGSVARSNSLTHVHIPSLMSYESPMHTCHGKWSSIPSSVQLQA